jgi:hypothetical protein
MNIKPLGTESNGTRSVEIRSNELSYRALLRCIRAIPGGVVTDTAHDPMNDNAKASIRYKDAALTLETPFSDYIIINCAVPSEAFDEFVSKLRDHKVKWWDKIF